LSLETNLEQLYGLKVGCAFDVGTAAEILVDPVDLEHPDQP